MSDPNSPLYLNRMRKHAETLRMFLDSDDFKEATITWLCHSRTWHYDHQVLRVTLLPRGKWLVPSLYPWTSNGSCVVVIWQASYFRDYMAEVGETRDFEDILANSPGEVSAVAEKLYASQEQRMKEQTKSFFEYLRKNGSLS